MAAEQQGPQRREPASPATPMGDPQRIARGGCQTRQSERVTMGREEQEREKKRRELATFPCRTHAKC